MRINTNIPAMNTYRQYTINNNNIAKSVEKLSSGYRINRAGDDAAGLAISEKMRAQIRGLQMASKNSQDAISLVQTAEGALQTTHDILQRMRELAVQSASDTNETTIDRSALDREFQALLQEIDDTANKTKFNDMGLLDGNFAKDIKNMSAAGGFAAGQAGGKNKASFGPNTAAGTYNITAGVTKGNTNINTNSGVLPQADYSAMNGGNYVSDAKLSLKDATAGSNGAGLTVDYGDNTQLTNAKANVGADGFTVNMQFDLEDGDGNTIQLNGSFVLDNATADQKVSINLGNGSKFEMTAKAGASVGDIARELNSMLTPQNATADGTNAKIDFSGGSIIQITGWDGNTVKSSDINGSYGLKIGYTAGGAGGTGGAQGPGNNFTFGDTKMLVKIGSTSDSIGDSLNNKTGKLAVDGTDGTDAKFTLDFGTLGKFTNATGVNLATTTSVTLVSDKDPSQTITLDLTKNGYTNADFAALKNAMSPAANAQAPTMKTAATDYDGVSIAMGAVSANVGASLDGKTGTLSIADGTASDGSKSVYTLDFGSGLKFVSDEVAFDATGNVTLKNSADATQTITIAISGTNTTDYATFKADLNTNVGFSVDMNSDGVDAVAPGVDSSVIAADYDGVTMTMGTISNAVGTSLDGAIGTLSVASSQGDGSDAVFSLTFDNGEVYTGTYAMDSYSTGTLTLTNTNDSSQTIAIALGGTLSTDYNTFAAAINAAAPTISAEESVSNSGITGITIDSISDDVGDSIDGLTGKLTITSVDTDGETTAFKLDFGGGNEFTGSGDISQAGKITLTNADGHEIVLDIAGALSSGQGTAFQTHLNALNASAGAQYTMNSDGVDATSVTLDSGTGKDAAASTVVSTATDYDGLAVTMGAISNEVGAYINGETGSLTVDDTDAADGSTAVFTLTFGNGETFVSDAVQFDTNGNIVLKNTQDDTQTITIAVSGTNTTDFDTFKADLNTNVGFGVEMNSDGKDAKADTAQSVLMTGGVAGSGGSGAIAPAATVTGGALADSATHGVGNITIGSITTADGTKLNNAAGTLSVKSTKGDGTEAVFELDFGAAGKFTSGQIDLTNTTSITLTNSLTGDTIDMALDAAMKPGEFAAFKADADAVTVAMDSSGTAPATGASQFTVELTDDSGRTKAYGTVSTTLDATNNKISAEVDFGGDYGKMTFDIDASSLAGATDFEAALNQALSDWSSANAGANNVVKFSGGVSGDIATGADKAAFTITGPDGNAETVELKAGMSAVTSASGITINFGRELTAADLADDTALKAALGGSLTGSVTVDSTEGKGFVVQTGANQGDRLSINIAKMDSWSLGISVASVGSRENASNAITMVNDAINAISMQRADLGALQNRLEFKIQNLDISAENLSSAESRIRDLDMAKEMTNFTRNQILAQAATAMLAQANALPQGVLQLLGG